MISQKDRDLFENLFVLEVANNHWGKLDRGLKLFAIMRKLLVLTVLKPQLNYNSEMLMNLFIRSLKEIHNFDISKKPKTLK